MEDLIHTLAKTVWGAPLAVMIAALGLFLTVRSGFLQIIKFPIIMKNTFGRLFSKKGGAGDAFRAMCVALGGTIGVGNIAGVSTAIINGGPGAVFWMWVSGFIGMIVKFFEVSLAVKFREIKNGEPRGGPMYYMKNSGVKFLRLPAYIFAVFCVFASLAMGGVTQSSTIAGSAAVSFGAPPCAVAVALSVALLPVITGKTGKIQRFSGIFVPLMSSVYIICCLVVILSRPARSIDALISIFSTAFEIKPAISGVGGFALSRAVSAGLSRGLFTNEAGLGSAPIAHASNRKATPVSQGMWGVAEVFADTIVICTLTAVAVLSTNVFSENKTLNGLQLSSSGFDEVFGQGIGQGIITACIFMFAYASIVAWGFYGKCALEFLTDKNTYQKIYLIVFLSTSAAGAFLDSGLCFEIADIVNAPLLIINIVAICLLYTHITTDPDYLKFFNCKKERKKYKN